MPYLRSPGKRQPSAIQDHAKGHWLTIALGVIVIVAASLALLYFSTSSTPTTNSEIPKRPIVLDMDGEGIAIVDKHPSEAFFDVDLDGFREETSWIAPNDAFLVMDANGNQAIDNGCEMVNDHRRYLPDECMTLPSLDENGDLLINAQDEAFHELLLWQDEFGDGVSEPGELTPLAETGVVSIAIDQGGNPLHFSNSTGETGLVQAVYLVFDNMVTWRDEEECCSSVRTFGDPPCLRGYGRVECLHPAMENNPELREMVAVMAEMDDIASLYTAIDDLLAVWTGADHISPTDEKDGYNARKLVILEAMLGEEMPALQDEHLGCLDSLYSIIKNHTFTTFAIQSVYSEKFSRCRWGAYHDRFVCYVGEDMPAYFSLMTNATERDELPYLGIIIDSMDSYTGVTLETLEPFVDPEAYAVMRDPYIGSEPVLPHHYHCPG
ncbi:MAG: hypothetical protein D6E12_04830 [Desulfovibrio sp.]|nr:MAG: hypothetical protein D6E12_04830 [Desulfovibrio sp.]